METKLVEFCGTFGNNGGNICPGAKLFGPEGEKVASIRRKLDEYRWVDEFEVDPTIIYLLTLVDFSLSANGNGGVIYATQIVGGEGKLSNIQKRIKESFQRRPK